jgi:diguanylate cyclase
MPLVSLPADLQAALPLVALLAGLSLPSLLGFAWWQRQRGQRLHRKMLALRQALGEAHARDTLTGLLNRGSFEARLEQAVQACDDSDSQLVVLYLGLDNLRLVNEGWGHDRGDEALKQVAQRLCTAVDARGDCSLARLVGDEFAVLAPGGLGVGHPLAAQLLQVVQRPIAPSQEGQNDLHLSVSIGLALYPSHGARSRLLAHAHMAMQSVKTGGGNGFADFEPAMAVDHRARALLHNDLQTALERRQFELVYQPKVDAKTLQVTGAEALLRWNHPQRGMVSPALFIPVAERHGLISAIGNWVIDEACRQAAIWRAQGLRMRVAVNLSGYQIRQDDLVERIVAALQRNQLEPTRISGDGRHAGHAQHLRQAACCRLVRLDRRLWNRAFQPGFLAAPASRRVED